MNRYKKKPEIVEAIQLRWSTWPQVCDFIGMTGPSPQNFAYHISADKATDTCGEEGPHYLAFVVTNARSEANTVKHGDWIVPDWKPGTFFPLKPEEFEAKYDLIEERR